MVGQTTLTKPSRSDEVLDANQQLQITNRIRARFDSIAPKRPAKPSRSESDTISPITSSDAGQITIPEFEKLRSLQSQSPVVLSAERASTEEDEFVETQYYKEMNSIDKQHHTTGSGFIKVQNEEISNDYDTGVSGRLENGTQVSGYKSNPATNDWIPCPEDHQVYVSSKPNRSESS